MNVLSVIICFCLALAFGKGRRYGLIRSIIRLGGRMVVFAVALLWSRQLGDWLQQSVMQYLPGGADTGMGSYVANYTQSFFTSGLAFGFIVVLGNMAIRTLERQTRVINQLPLLGTANRLAGGFVYFFLVYVEIFFILQFTQGIDLPWYQDQIIHSSLAQWMLTQTPYFSKMLYEWWQGTGYVMPELPMSR